MHWSTWNSVNQQVISSWCMSTSISWTKPYCTAKTLTYSNEWIRTAFTFHCKQNMWWIEWLRSCHCKTVQMWQVLHICDTVAKKIQIQGMLKITSFTTPTWSSCLGFQASTTRRCLSKCGSGLKADNSHKEIQQNRTKGSCNAVHSDSKSDSNVKFQSELKSWTLSCAVSVIYRPGSRKPTFRLDHLAPRLADSEQGHCDLVWPNSNLQAQDVKAWTMLTRWSLKSHAKQRVSCFQSICTETERCM